MSLGEFFAKELWSSAKGKLNARDTVVILVLLAGAGMSYALTSQVVDLFNLLVVGAWIVVGLWYLALVVFKRRPAGMALVAACTLALAGGVVYYSGEGARDARKIEEEIEKAERQQAGGAMVKANRTLKDACKLAKGKALELSSRCHCMRASLLISMGKTDKAKIQAIACEEVSKESRNIARQVEATVIAADIERLFGTVENARLYYGEAIKLAGDYDEKRGEAIALIGLGELELLEGAPAKAREALDAAIEVFDAHEDQIGAARAHLKLGDLEFFLGNMDAAIGELDEARQIFEESEEKVGEVEALNKLGIVAQSIGEVGNARKRLDRAMGISSKFQNHFVRIDVLLSLGRLDFVQGDLVQARDHFETAYEQSVKVEYAMGEATALEWLGVLDSIAGKMEDSRSKWADAKKIFRRMKYGVGEVKMLLREGNQDTSLGKYRAAKGEYDKAKKLTPSLGSPRLEAILMESKAGLSIARGKYVEAARLASESIEVCGRIGDVSGKAKAHRLRGRALGLMSKDLSRRVEATAEFDRSVGIAERIKNRRLLASAMQERGKLHRTYGDYDEARDEYDKVATILDEIGDVQGQANVELLWGSLEKATAVRPDGTADYRKARDRYVSARLKYGKIGSQIGLANADKELGALELSENNFGKAEMKLQNALEMYEDLGSLLGQAQTRNHLASLRFKQGDAAGADENWKLAIKHYLELGDRPKAEGVEQRSTLLVAPQKFRLGQQLLKDGKLAEALNAFLVAQNDPVNRAESVVKIGYCAKELGLYGLALHYLRLLLPPMEGVPAAVQVSDAELAEAKREVARLESKTGEVLVMSKANSDVAVYVDGVERGKPALPILVAADVEHKLVLVAGDGVEVSLEADMFTVGVKELKVLEI